SAVGYYGPHTDENIDEDIPAGDDYLASVCADWEAASARVENFGVRRVIIRIGLMFTAQGGIFTRLQLPFKLFAGGPMGSGKQYYSWIHMQDGVAAIRFLIENKQAQGAFNLTAPNPVTSRHFGLTLGKVMGRPSLLPVPGFALKIALGEVSMTALTGQRVIPKRLLEMGFDFKYPDLEDALLEIVNQ
ncbi:TIGR01777 family oxidoreductase, partial [Chloroflexota bacterium]